MANKRYNKQVPGFESGGRVGLQNPPKPPKPQYITKKEKPQYITKKSKFITKKKKPVQSESKYITRKEKPKSIREKIAPKKKMDRLKELREELK